GHENVVRKFLSDERVLVNAANNLGWTPLFEATSRGHTNIVRMMLSNERVDVNARENTFYAPLILAAM
ncbi:hypothetical protein L873DRAFT_1657038, partial [Choiromyces venosus 120613-1]